MIYFKKKYLLVFSVDLAWIGCFYWWFFSKANGNQWILVFSLEYENKEYFDIIFLPTTAVSILN